MKKSYQLKKKWAAFWQNYNLKKQLTIIARLFAFVLIIWIVGSILTIISQYTLAPEHHDNIFDYLYYFWIVIIELVSGFDIPDDIPLHMVSRIISILMLFMNLTVVAVFTGQIITMFSRILKRADFIPEKPLKFQFVSPILICGINDKIRDIIAEIRNNQDFNDREIIVVDELSDKVARFEDKDIHDVWFVKGNPMDEQTLAKALGKEDNRVIILSEKNKTLKLSDTNAINTALAVEYYYKNVKDHVHTVLEINDPKNKFHFRRTKINEWICIQDYALKLISQSILQKNIIQGYLNLISNDNQICISDDLMKKEFYGKTFGSIKKEVYKKYREQNILVLGFAKNLTKTDKQKMGLCLRNTPYFIQLNPTKRKEIIHDSIQTKIPGAFKIIDEVVGKWVFSKNTILKENDKLVYLKRHTNQLKARKFHLSTKKEDSMETDKQVNSLKQQIEKLEKENKGLKRKIDKTALKDHIIICNWNSKARIIIEEVHDETVTKDEQIPIVIIAQRTDNIIESEASVFRNVFTIQGDPASDDTLKRANIGTAATVVVLADEENIETADPKSILISLAVDSINPEAHLIVELVNSSNEKYFKYTHVDEIICLEQLAEKLLAQSVLTPGLSRVYMDLLTQSSDTNEIYLEQVPEQFVGKKYAEIEKEIMESKKDIILIGFSTIMQKTHSNGTTVKTSRGKAIHGRQIVINPSPEHVVENATNGNYTTDHILKKDDQLFMISYDKPYLNYVLQLENCLNKEKISICLKNSDAYIEYSVKEIHGAFFIAKNLQQDRKTIYYRDVKKMKLKAKKES